MRIRSYADIEGIRYQQRMAQLQAEEEARRRQTTPWLYPSPPTTLPGGVPNPAVYRTPGAFAQALFTHAAQKQEEARQANLQRYQEILSGYQGLKQEAMGLVQGLGAAQQAELARRFGGIESQAYQELVNRGLAKSTVWPTVQAGIGRQYGYALANLAEQMARERLGVLTGLGGAQLQFMERRADEYPDINTLLQLAQMLGFGQGALGGGPVMGRPIWMAPQQIGMQVPALAWGPFGMMQRC